MTPDVSERAFEDAIELVLLAGGPDAPKVGPAIAEARDGGEIVGPSGPGTCAKFRPTTTASARCQARNCANAMARLPTPLPPRRPRVAACR